MFTKSAKSGAPSSRFLLPLMQSPLDCSPTNKAQLKRTHGITQGLVKATNVSDQPRHPTCLHGLWVIMLTYSGTTIRYRDSTRHLRSHTFTVTRHKSRYSTDKPGRTRHQGFPHTMPGTISYAADLNVFCRSPEYENIMAGTT